MATEIVATRFVIDESHVKAIKVMLLQSIRAGHELDLVSHNLVHAVEAKITMKDFNSLMLPQPVDIDAGEAAEMVMILDMLEEAP